MKTNNKTTNVLILLTGGLFMAGLIIATCFIYDHNTKQNLKKCNGVTDSCCEQVCEHIQ